MKSLMFFLGAFLIGGHAHADSYHCTANLNDKTITIGVVDQNHVSMNIGGKTYLGQFTTPKYTDDYVHFSVDENQPQFAPDAVITQIEIRPWMQNGTNDDTRPGDFSALIDITVTSGYFEGSHVAFYTCKRSSH